ncbi:CehA/McbA family metallohydrolase [Archangium sp.]|uniref:CehA/McbA family metallohydrolase n=1 Tax=Archangium sp. TaxID=1872627 RepID=UPI002D6CACAF|nr:CehA/McbA family metallohydrolase [Archangium sp.]HYO56001.1 CehA/McbA family metallohydrolase [Archangium sp.]
MLASTGDFLLANDRVMAVVDALEHPHYFAPSGGALIDLVTVEGNRDSLTHIFQATGLLPRDAVRYTEHQFVEEGDIKALVLRGHLDGEPRHRVVTRYEIRPCEPGLRLRTEIYNGTPEPTMWTVSDGLFWGGRSNIPFTPGPGRGYTYPPLDLANVDGLIEETPYVIGTIHGVPGSAYVDVACNLEALQGFNGEKISAMGTPRHVVQPRDYEVFERFIGVVDGASVGPAADLALELRQQIHGEPWTTLSGKLVLAADDGRVDDEVRVTVFVSEGTTQMAEEARTPWTQITPGPDGRFSVRVPAGRPYVVEVRAFGRTVLARDVRVGSTPGDVGTLEVPPAAQLSVSVTLDGAPANAWVFLHPADEQTREAVTARMMEQGVLCAPMLGSQNGESPACNRLIARNGAFLLTVPPGHYDVYAAAGPFRTIAREPVRIQPATSRSVSLALSSLPLRPAGSLAADLHVHGAGSFDASISPSEQLEAILASDLDIAIISDHNVVQDYTALARTRGVQERLRLISGIETTGLILFDYVPGVSFPKVIGHWSFWSLPYVPDAPYRGAPWDQLIEPGTLFTRMYEAGMSEHGLIQLNHPWSVLEVGRDLAFSSAIGLDATRPLTSDYDGTAASLFNRKPEGSRFRNSDYHVQEVMSGTDNARYQAYRAFWFYLLNQGVIRGGTASSDSHGLARNMVGSPRSIVFTRTTVTDFDEEVFNADIRAGHVLGTNGPIIEASLIDGEGKTFRPSVNPFTPGSDARLRLRVTAAPWVPVEEIRIVVDGSVRRVLSAELHHPADPFGKDGLLRYEGELRVSELLPAAGKDAWIVIEAGHPLVPNADLDCNGIPDTGDNNGDGVIDWRDVDRNLDEVIDEKDLDTDGNGKISSADEPARCKTAVGPLQDPRPGTDRNEPRYHFAAVQQIAAASLIRMASGYPTAFTNPFLLDLDGVAGFRGPQQ